MKKTFISLLALSLTVGLAACSTVPEATATATATTPTQYESEVVQEALAGGWTINKDNSLTSMPQDVATAWYGAVTDDKYVPVALLGTQVVAGINYMFLAKDSNGNLCTVVIYSDLQGNSSILKESPFDLIAMVSSDGSNTPTGLAGGYTVNPDTDKMADVSAEDKDIFNRALNGTLGVTYAPVTVLATQVVAGQNIAYLATGTSATQNAETNLYVVSIYRDLDNNVSVNNICAVNLAMLTE